MTEHRVADIRKAGVSSGNGNNQMKVKKVRTPKSCDRCKSRKTKVGSALIAHLRRSADWVDSALIQVCTPFYTKIKRKCGDGFISSSNSLHCS
jgi:hypothetical protein